MSEDNEFVDVWQKASDQDRQDVAAFWKSEGAVVDEQSILQRLPQLCVLARSPNGDLLAVTTAYLQFSQGINNNVYVLRMFVAEAARRTKVGFQLLHQVIEVLEGRYVSGDDRNAVGVLFELENPIIQKARPEAIWPTTGFVYIGNNARGDHVRIRYFKGARIA